ncbi:MAG: AmmeMemoRadiSam system protein B [Gammaproteobacteria bacterium]|nr:AmmeMemoRadiSam system protein B [Gammaproteobacteria bacterium]
MSENIRQPAVAGTFYPADAQELNQQIDDFLSQAAKHRSTKEITPKAIIVPHAGYIYSGPVAASAYCTQIPSHARINRVVLLGPSHRVPFTGLATSSATHYITPLGPIPLDRASLDRLNDFPQVNENDMAHLYEHSLEVQLPFLQKVLDDFVLVPLVVGDADSQSVAEVLEQLWGDEHTLIVISSDLSHYHDYSTAKEMDQATSHAIETLNPSAIQYGDACGRNPINGLLLLAKQKNMQIETVDLRNSGDTAGPRDQVVGYGAYLFYSHHA